MARKKWKVKWGPGPRDVEVFVSERRAYGKVTELRDQFQAGKSWRVNAEVFSGNGLDWDLHEKLNFAEEQS